MVESKSRPVNKYACLKVVFDLLVLLLLTLLFAIWLFRYTLPGSPFVVATEQWFGSDSNMHISFGFLLTLCLGWLIRLWQQPLRRQLWLFVVVLVCFGVDELGQNFFGGRSVDIQDFLMSVSGWGLAVVCWFASRFLLYGDYRR